MKIILSVENMILAGLWVWARVGNLRLEHLTNIENVNLHMSYFLRQKIAVKQTNKLQAKWGCGKKFSSVFSLPYLVSAILQYWKNIT
jgi:hypothetical protein